jgi:adenosylhomocysteine nucleosidase
MRITAKENKTIPQAVILISARAEWNVAVEFYENPAVESSPLGKHFQMPVLGINCLFFHGGWGKVAAAASAQYVIDRWQPRLIVNLGTCGGFEGAVNVGEVILADETVIYDIYERMGDPQAARAHFTTRIDLSYLRQPYPHPVRIGRLVSADQDIDPAMVETLKYEYGAAAADWESGAIAWTAARNGTRVLILRAVSDLVGVGGGELYDQGDFQQRARGVMLPLLRALPAWLDCAL